MINSIRPSLHITLSYTFVAVLLAGCFNYIISPALQKRSEYRQAISDAQFRNARFMANIEDYRTTLENTEVLSEDEVQEQVADNRLINARTPALAGAQLQEQLRKLITPLDAELTSATVLRTNPSGVFHAIAVNLRLRSSVSSLEQLLYSIESDDLALFIDSLHIQSRHRPGREIGNIHDELEVRMDVKAYFRTADSE